MSLKPAKSMALVFRLFGGKMRRRQSGCLFAAGMARGMRTGIPAGSFCFVKRKRRRSWTGGAGAASNCRLLLFTPFLSLEIIGDGQVAGPFVRGKGCRFVVRPQRRIAHHGCSIHLGFFEQLPVRPLGLAFRAPGPRSLCRAIRRGFSPCTRAAQTFTFQAALDQGAIDKNDDLCHSQPRGAFAHVTQRLRPAVDDGPGSSLR